MRRRSTIDIPDSWALAGISVADMHQAVFEMFGVAPPVSDIPPRSPRGRRPGVQLPGVMRPDGSPASRWRRIAWDMAPGTGVMVSSTHSARAIVHALNARNLRGVKSRWLDDHRFYLVWALGPRDEIPANICAACISGCCGFCRAEVSRCVCQHRVEFVPGNQLAFAPSIRPNFQRTNGLEIFVQK